MRRSTRGFTLFELVLVMFIVALLSTAALTPLKIQLEARARRVTAADLDRAVEALYGFALVHGRLPCPDAFDDGDGLEDRSSDQQCAVREGYLPSVELAVTARDAWGNRFRYQVTARDHTTSGSSNFTVADDGLCAANDGDFDLCERGDIEVRSRGDDPSDVSLQAKFDFVRANGIPALVLSHGANGHGVHRPGSTMSRNRVPGRNLDERENIDGDKVFYARGYSVDQPGCADDRNERTALCEFDDLLRWLSPTIINNRMVSAGRLP